LIHFYKSDNAALFSKFGAQNSSSL